MANYLVFIAGSDIDYYYEVESFLKEGDACMAKPLGKKVGGCVLNAAVTSSKLGSNVKVIDYLKENDEDTDLLIQSIKENNIDISHIKYDKDATNGTCLIMKKDNEKCIYVIEPSRPFYKEDEEMKDLLFNASYIYSLMHTLKISFKDIELLKEAKRKGVKIIFDAGSQYKEDYEIEYLKELATGIFINKTAVERLNEKCGYDLIEDLLKKDLEFACITDGSKGASCYTKDKIYYEPAYKINVVDSTGAGDSFAGAFLHFLNKGYDYMKCLEYANANGAYACTKEGGNAGAITEEELLSFIDKNA